MRLSILLLDRILLGFAMAGRYSHVAMVECGHAYTAHCETPFTAPGGMTAAANVVALDEYRARLRRRG